MSWKCIDTGKRFAAENMALDEGLLSDLQYEHVAILHFYDWKYPSATYGYFVDPEKFFFMEEVKKIGLDLARRPTGGGILFHHVDFAFSVLVPATHPAFSQKQLENYEFVNIGVSNALKKIINKPMKLLENSQNDDEECKNFCMATPTKYDVIIDEKKIGGAAQRNTKYGYLHQGTISICNISEQFLTPILKNNEKILEAMKKNSFSLLGNIASEKELLDARLEIKELIREVFS